MAIINVFPKSKIKVRKNLMKRSISPPLCPCGVNWQNQNISNFGIYLTHNQIWLIYTKRVIWFRPGECRFFLTLMFWKYDYYCYSFKSTFAKLSKMPLLVTTKRKITKTVVHYQSSFSQSPFEKWSTDSYFRSKGYSFHSLAPWKRSFLMLSWI